jgi:DNA-binding NarL/FixJ family response regulator
MIPPDSSLRDQAVRQAEFQRRGGCGRRVQQRGARNPRHTLVRHGPEAAGKRSIPSEVAARLAEYMSDDALTPRETEVLQGIAGGNRNREIADLLFISEETVKVHVKHIMDKLGAKDRTQAVSIGVRRGIIHL